MFYKILIILFSNILNETLFWVNCVPWNTKINELWGYWDFVPTLKKYWKICWVVNCLVQSHPTLTQQDVDTFATHFHPLYLLSDSVFGRSWSDGFIKSSIQLTTFSRTFIIYRAKYYFFLPFSLFLRIWHTLRANQTHSQAQTHSQSHRHTLCHIKTHTLTDTQTPHTPHSLTDTHTVSEPVTHSQTKPDTLTLTHTDTQTDLPSHTQTHTNWHMNTHKPVVWQTKISSHGNIWGIWSCVLHVCVPRFKYVKKSTNGSKIKSFPVPSRGSKLWAYTIYDRGAG